MREIKFRAKNIKTGEIDYCFNPVAHGEYNFFEFSKVVNCFCPKWIPDWVLEQWTGELDMDGKEVYEVKT